MEPTTPFTEDERYRLLVEAVTDYAIFMVDPNGIVSSWNPGAQRFKGYLPNEIIGKHFSQFYTEEDRKSGLPERALRTARLEGKFETEGWRVRKDGTRFWAAVVIDPILSRSGDLLAYAKITRDLTERKDAERKLKQSEEQFRLLVQGVVDYAIYMIDIEGKVTNWNLGAQRIKGYAPDEIIGRHFSQFYTDEDRAAGLPRRALETASREGKFESEGWRVRKDGNRFWAHVVIDALRDETGTLLGFAKITRDITERKEAQTKLDMARDALSQSQKMEAIGHLTGGVAHDFNNLLMVVLSGLELIRRRLPPDPKVTSLLDNVVQAAKRGSVLTTRMLAFARRQELKSETIHMPELVYGMGDMLQRTLGQSVSIETHFPLNLSLISADANQLEMALLNLAVNARDAMPRGGKIVIAADEEALDLGSSNKMKPGRYVRLSVTDTGVGMDEETLKRAMEPFFTTKGVGKGTGLGLPMVHGLAEQFGGRFVLRSRVGEGTIAEIWLPTAERLATPEPIPSPAPAVKRYYEPLVVLAVDDDPLVLTNTVAMLEELGHTAIEASSGRRALEILRDDNSIDVVVTDQVMPVMTGAELAKTIREEWPKLYIILATGFAEMPADSIALPRLSKPFTQADLAEKISVYRQGDRKGRLLRLRDAENPKA